MSSRNDAVIMDLALALFDRLRGQDVTVLIVGRDGKVGRFHHTFEYAEANGKAVKLKMSGQTSGQDGCLTLDVDPSMCRKLNPPSSDDYIRDESVMVGGDESNFRALYHIILCIKNPA